ncbi:probable galacturonosyltransferase 15 isoform X1 [Primulina eburnea]|uniref:probable galacturonosyltransferase 15 isoform X1 n=2 Tax=Primulina eburnea TaxID=1245227 RepID=UPI003C6C0E03
MSRNMKLYISTTGTKRVAAYSAAAEGAGVGGTRSEMKGKSSPSTAFGRRLYRRAAILTAVLLFGLVLPLLFIRTAFLVLESASICSSSIGCMTLRIFGGSDAALLREELTRALLEATTSNDDYGGGIGIGTVERSNIIPVTFKDLVEDMASNKQDIKAFAFKTKAVIEKMEHMVKTAKWQESFYWHLAAHGVPNSMHCLSLKLTEEYAINAVARSRLPLPQYVHRLADASFQHVVLLTDNVLAASVVISSTIKTSVNPKNLVFHVITDKKTYTSMHAWFAMNTIDSAVIEVKGLHQYEWSHEVNVGIKEVFEIHHQIVKYNSINLKEGFNDKEDCDHKLGVLSPSGFSLLNHLRIYLPELFPDLDKVVLLDDDIVAQHDLSSLWDLDLNDKVVGAVVDSWCGRDCCPGRKYKDYFNFTDPIIISSMDPDNCGWQYGMAIFDLKKWRKTNITAVYHQWLKLNLNSGFILWHPGALPPALIAFKNHVHQIDSSWQLAGLGYRFPQVDKQMSEAAAVIHFSGPAKPWLEIASPEVRHLWTRHVNFSNECIRRCGIAG